MSPASSNRSGTVSSGLDRHSVRARNCLRSPAWGENRYQSLDIGGNLTPTTFRFTGQRLESKLGGGEGLYYYGARWYDPILGRFIQPDPIVPSVSVGNYTSMIGYESKTNYSQLIVDYHDIKLLEQQNQENRKRISDTQGGSPSVSMNPPAFDRFSYTINNPVRYTDPTGYNVDCAVNEYECKERVKEESKPPFDTTLGGNSPKSKSNIQNQNTKPKLPVETNSNAGTSDYKIVQLIAGATLIVLTDLFVGLPAAYLLVVTGGVTPTAVAAEAIETFVVLPINILGIYLIYDATRR